MARGVKKLSLEEQLAKVEADIAATEEQLKDFKSQKKEIEAAIKEEKLRKLLAIVEEKGLTIDQAIEKISE